jgi:Zn-dependent metalloprotease
MRKKAAVVAGAVISAALATTMSSPAASAPAAERPTRAESALDSLAAHPRLARDADGQAFVVRDVLVDRDGSSHVRMDRTYQGLRVIGGDLVVHQSASRRLTGVSQTLKQSIDVSTRPAISARAAESRAESSRYARAIRSDGKEAQRELVVYAAGKAPRLAWEVVTGGVQKDGTPSVLSTYVNARNGKLLGFDQEIHTVEGDGQSLYSGTVPLQLTLASGTYRLQDPTRGNSATYDMNNRSDSIFCQLFGFGCQLGTLFSSPDNHFGNGSTSSRESAGVDAAYGGAVTWDYFKVTHGRNGIFGNGTGAPSRVHYGSNYVNAFWDGSKMTYGDGNGSTFGPLVSLDVAGHEMSHGVTENSANLTYSGESGGLNESTSDIFGSLVEAYAANPNDPADYLIGEEFDLASHLGFRRMDDPDSDGDSVNCWSSGAGNLDVHYSSGIGNHFFYLLAEGSGAKIIGGVQHNSTTCNGSTVTGIGAAKAGKIWYRALTVYMTSSTNYAGARTATLNAASDLYGATSPERAAVAAAWSAVSVN